MAAEWSANASKQARLPALLSVVDVLNANDVTDLNLGKPPESDAT